MTDLGLHDEKQALPRGIACFFCGAKFFYKKNEPYVKRFRFSLCTEDKMDDISALIKEAKPLYFARKRRNNFIKCGVAVLFCAVMVNIFTTTSYTYVFNDEWAQAVDSAAQGSVIADMGLPTDDYGLLMVV